MNQCFLKINDVQRYVPIVEQAGLPAFPKRKRNFNRNYK